VRVACPHCLVRYDARKDCAVRPGTTHIVVVCKECELQFDVYFSAPWLLRIPLIRRIYSKVVTDYEGGLVRKKVIKR